MTVFIYGLKCPLSGAIRYIGKTDDLQRRYKTHLACRNPKHPKDLWVKSLIKKGATPLLVVLREVALGEDWATTERDEIATAKLSGIRLFNVTLGGEGVSLSDEQRQRKAERMRDPETRRKMSEAAKARWADPEKRAAGIAANSAPEKRALLSESAMRRATPEYCEAAAEKTRAAWADETKRQRIVSGITDETRRSVSEASKRFWAESEKAKICRANLKKATQEVLEKAQVARSTPEYRAKMQEIFRDPAYRAKLSASLRASWDRRKRKPECASSD